MNSLRRWLTPRYNYSRTPAAAYVAAGVLPQSISMRIYTAIQKVFHKKKYWAIAFVSSILFLLLAIFLSLGRFTFDVITSSIYDSTTKFRLIILSLGNFGTNFLLRSQISLLLISSLIGINLSVLWYILSEVPPKSVQNKTGISGILGIIAGLFGVGCAACGSVLIIALFGTTATGAVLGVLPLRGFEFTLVSIVLLVVSLFGLAKQVVKPPVCMIKKEL